MTTTEELKEAYLREVAKTSLIAARTERQEGMVNRLKAQLDVEETILYTDVTSLMHQLAIESEARRAWETAVSQEN